MSFAPNSGDERDVPARTFFARNRMLLGVVLVAALARLAELGREPLWLDEAFSWRWAHLPITELWGSAARLETNPPLWFTIERAALLLLGEGEAVLRAPAAFFGIAAVPLAWAIAREIAGPRAATLAAWFLALAPLQVAYAQEARGYSLLVFAALLSTWGLLVFAKASFELGEPTGECGRERSSEGIGRHRGLVAYAIGGTIALYAHNTGALLLLLANLGVLGWWFAARTRDPRTLIPWFAANVLLAVVLLPWLPVVSRQIVSAANVAWIRQPSLLGALFETARLYGPHFVLEDASFVRALLAAPIACAGLVAMRDASERRGILFLALLAAGLPALVWAAGLVLRPLWIERVLLSSHAMGLVLAAIGVASLKSGLVRTALAGCLLAIAATDLAAWYARAQKVPWTEAIATAAAEAGPKDLFVVVPHFYHWPFAYYARSAGLPEADVGVYPETPPPAEAPVLPSIDRGVRFLSASELETALADREGAWLFVYKRRGGDPGGVLGRLARLGCVELRGTWRGSWDTGELELFRFVRSRVALAPSSEAKSASCDPPRPSLRTGGQPE
ncbi:MAG: glycosyltransferase family 39 protein [Geminicoccaceae bacterium]|nr:glycosyltransferase family 39 protein [Geminicoccaceae bacterium]